MERERYALVPIYYFYHPALLIKFQVNLRIKPFNATVYDYLNYDYNIIRSLLATINWDRVFHNLLINDKVDMFLILF
jgi:hypothetical protein